MKKILSVALFSMVAMSAPAGAMLNSEFAKEAARLHAPKVSMCKRLTNLSYAALKLVTLGLVVSTGYNYINGQDIKPAIVASPNTLYNASLATPEYVSNATANVVDVYWTHETANAKAAADVKAETAAKLSAVIAATEEALKKSKKA